MNANYVLDKLLASLWVKYKHRVPYAAQYQEMVEQRGGDVQNDHIAFRTFNTTTGTQPPGAEAIARVFVALGYQQKDRYVFEDKKLLAWHYEHKLNPDNPKIFISQLEVNQLSTPIANKINQSVAEAPDLLSLGDKKMLGILSKGESIDKRSADIAAADLARFFSRPWTAPLRHVVEDVDKESQYAAWTLLHGNSVNHFTAYINEQNVKEWPDIETTVTALRHAGLPMKDEFEGERGSKLRQSSTKAVMEDCDVTEEDGTKSQINWSYAYYEFAERGTIADVDGKTSRFQGFLGAQATNLFDMTKRR
jgi:hypothetical protein